jgi:hypothetical protein
VESGEWRVKNGEGRGEERIGKTAMLMTNTNAGHEGHELREYWKPAMLLTNRPLERPAFSRYVLQA